MIETGFAYFRNMLAKVEATIKDEVDFTYFLIWPCVIVSNSGPPFLSTKNTLQVHVNGGQRNNIAKKQHKGKNSR